MDLAKNKEQMLSLPRKDRRKILNKWTKMHNESDRRDFRKIIKGEIKWLKKSLKEK